MQKGDKVPDLLGHDENGNEIRLSQLGGKKLVLYFYPKDMTSGCTAQACNLRDNYDRLKSEGYEVLGVSIDTARKHQQFIEKTNCPSISLPTSRKPSCNSSVCGEKRNSTDAATWERCAPHSSSRPMAPLSVSSHPKKSRPKTTPARYWISNM